MPLLCPFLTTVHESRVPGRRLLSTRVSQHPRLAELFPSNIAESYVLDQTDIGWVAGGHRHQAKHELMRCLSGSLLLTLRNLLRCSALSAIWRCCSALRLCCSLPCLCCLLRCFVHNLRHCCVERNQLN